MGFDLGEELAGIFTGGATFLTTGNPVLAFQAYDKTKDLITTRSEIAEKQKADKKDATFRAEFTNKLPSQDIAKTATSDIQNVRKKLVCRALRQHATQ